MGIFSFLKAEKKENSEKIAASVGKDNSAITQGFMDVPHEDTFKAYIPNFLYKPPFGYPLNKDVIQLRNLAKNPYVFSVIRTLKDEASTSKWEIKVKKEFATNSKNNDYDSEIKRISAWFYNPNGNEESFNDIIAQWVTDLCEVDAAVGVKVFNKKKEFSQLFARDGATFLKNCDIYGYMGNRAEFVEPIQDTSFYTITPNMPLYNEKIKIYSTEYAQQAAYFQYGWTGVGLPVPFGRREIIYIAHNLRSDSIYGRSPIEVLYDALLTLIYGQQYNLDFYLNGNTPDGLLHLAGIDQDVADAFQARMSSKFTAKDSLGYNRRIGHRFPVYGGPEAKFIPFQISAKDMEIIEQQKWFSKLVWASFGVTPDEMGFTEDSNKAVSQAQQNVHKRKALKPLLKRIEYAINTQLMPELDPTGRFEFAFEDYDIDEELKKYQLYDMQIRIGVKTSEMVAEEEGINVGKLKEYKETEMQKIVNNLEAQNSENNPNQNNINDIGLKAEYIKMNLDELISEHKRLIKLLENSNNEKFKQEIEEQKKELDDYMKMKGFFVGDYVKIISGSKEHIGKIGQISKILNNGEEDYYEITLNDGIDICFKENIKKIINPHIIPEIKPENPEDNEIQPEPELKSDSFGLVEYFNDVKKKILERIEIERYKPEY